MNEFEAAMGLCVLDEIETITKQRAKVWEAYQKELSGTVSFQEWSVHSENNYAYAPVLFENEDLSHRVEEKLKSNQINPRRYFYPSLDTIDYMSSIGGCDVSRGIARRVLCLPIYPGLDGKDVVRITELISET
jgi:dTDP-4-amino-4,6-dideoxygalactose transaminase